MTLVLPTSRIYWGDLVLGAMYEGDHKVWEPEAETPSEWGPGESMLTDAEAISYIGPGDYNLGARFTVTADGRITHIRYWHTGGYAVGTTHTVSLWTTADRVQRVAVVDTSGSGPAASEWHEIELPEPFLVSAGISYTVAATTNNSWYAYSPEVVSIAPHLVDIVNLYGNGSAFPDIPSGGVTYHVDVIYERDLRSWGPGERMLDPTVVPNTTYVGDYTVGVKFKVVADGRITHFCNRNYDTTGTAMFRFYEDIAGMDAGTLITTLPVPVFYGQQDVPLPTPIEVFAGRTYILAFYSGPTNHYPYQDGVPTSLSPNLIDMRGTYQGGNTYPFYDGGQYYWLDVLYQEKLAGGPSYDPSTQAFLDATGLDELFADALDGLVRGLKEHGLWSKMLAVYPFIGGTADLHKWNLIDPRDADDAYRLTYTGPGAHSAALGYQPNPTGQYELGGYADTHLVPSSVMAQASTHLSLYSLEARPWAPRCDMGAYNWDGSTNRFHVIANYTSGEFYYSMSSRATPNVASGGSTGLFVSTRTTASDFAGHRNGAQLGAWVDAATELPYVPMHIGNITGYAREYSDLPFGFASLGSGLTAQEAADLYLVVQDFQAALGRSTPKQYWEEP